MKNPIETIVEFNEQAGLIEKGYCDFLESSFQIEEALEGFAYPHHLGQALEEGGVEPMVDYTPKTVSRAIVDLAETGYQDYDVTSISDVNRLDKACDAVIFAVGSMAKLGLNPNQIIRALNAVMDANMAKLGMSKDEFGKITKPSDFVGPEVELQKILDE